MAPVPPQYKEAEVIDFRNAALGLRGYKMSRKRTIEERQEQVNIQAIISLISRCFAHDLCGAKGKSRLPPDILSLNLL